MNVDALTLIDFLDARIAEDEAVASRAMSEGRQCGARLLADASARSRIVGRCRGASTGALRGVLRDLALSYADHRDFQIQWLPVGDDE